MWPWYIFVAVYYCYYCKLVSACDEFALLFTTPVADAEPTTLWDPGTPGADCAEKFDELTRCYGGC